MPLLTKAYAAGQVTAKVGVQLAARVIMKHPNNEMESPMSKKLMTAAVLAAVAFGVAAPAMAKGAPKTKAACEKISTMKWDDAGAKCVKK